MRVRHPKTMHDHANSLWLENFPHALADSLCNDNHPLGSGVIHIRKVINMGFRNHKALPGARRVKGHHRHHGLVLEDRACWLMAGDDLTEYASLMDFAHIFGRLPNDSGAQPPRFSADG